MKTVLITGGAGFIGTNFVHHLLETEEALRVTVLDALTYAGNRENLERREGHPHFHFVHGDIRDAQQVRALCKGVDAVVHMAAETHVDRSIENANEFLSTNVVGTQVLLDAVRDSGIQRFVHVSTDEVYGSIESGSFREDSPLAPSSPYSASKAASDLLALAHHATYGTPVVVTDFPGVRVTVEDGVTGYVARPGDPEELADRIHELIKNPQKVLTMGVAARKRVVELYDWQVIGDKLEKLYKSW